MKYYIRTLDQINLLIDELAFPKRSAAGSIPNYARDLGAAFILANKYKIGLVPQSEGEGVRWLGCDLESVFYRGDCIQLNPKTNNNGEECTYSTHSPALSICLAVLLTLNLEFEIEESLVG